MTTSGRLRTDRLRELRKQHGLTQRQLSQLCGFGLNQVATYETGERDPSATYLAILADQLGTSTDYLLGRSDTPHLIFSKGDLKDEERKLLEAFRREGWAGVAHLLAEHVRE